MSDKVMYNQWKSVDNCRQIKGFGFFPNFFLGIRMITDNQNSYCIPDIHTLFLLARNMTEIHCMVIQYLPYSFVSPSLLVRLMQKGWMHFVPLACGELDWLIILIFCACRARLQSLCRDQ